MSKSLTSEYIEQLKENGPDAGFEFIYNTCNQKIERFIYKKLLSYWCRDKKRCIDWGRCIDPENHKFDVALETLMKFSKFNIKFYESGYKLEIEKNIEALLFLFANNKIYEHFHCRICKEFPMNLEIENIDDLDYKLPAKNGGREIENCLRFKQARLRLEIISQEALEDRTLGLSLKEVSEKRNITIETAKTRRFRAIRAFRQLY